MKPLLHTALHLFLHILVPAPIARFGFPKYWIGAWLTMVATMAVDLDHLLATPVFDPHRCSIGFHPLHTGTAIAVYLVLTAVPKTRLAGVGLVVHMLLDGLDCLVLR